MEGLKNFIEALKFIIEITFEMLKEYIKIPFHADEETAIKLMLMSKTPIIVIIAIIITALCIHKIFIKKEKF